MSELPPHDLQAEAAVISGCVLDAGGSSLDVVRGLVTHEAFYHPAHKCIFAAMEKLADAAQPYDTVTIWSQLRHDQVTEVKLEYLAAVIDETPAVGNVAGHAALVRDCWLLRRALQEAQRIAVEARSFAGIDGPRVQEFLRDSEQSLAEIAWLRDGRKLRHVSEILVDVGRTLSAAFNQRSPITGQATGFTALDRMTTGQHDGDLLVLAGRPGTGKTAFALNAAAHIAEQGAAVAFFSLEMPAAQLVLRLLAAESQLDLNQLRTGAFAPNLWSSITQAMATLERVPLFVDDTAGISVLDVRARARGLQREIESGKQPSCRAGRLGAIMVDYAQLMSPMKLGRSREEEISSISNTAKRHAKELNVPYWLLSQLNREPEKRPDKRPRLSDLRESGSLEQDADLVVLLHRPEMHRPDDETLRGAAEAIVAKQRNGPTGTVHLYYRQHCTRFFNLVGIDDSDEAAQSDTWFAPERES
jgi:replicative DNA helicase